MSLGLGLLVMCLAGAAGGAINAIVSANGFFLPQHTTKGGAPIWRPGFLGTLAVGGFAAGVNWGLYGPFTNYFVLGSGQSDTEVGLTLASVATAALVGFTGARWLTNEVDKKLLRAAASQATASAADPATAAVVATASPAAVLDAVSLLPKG